MTVLPQYINTVISIYVLDSDCNDKFLHVKLFIVNDVYFKWMYVINLINPKQS